MPLFLLQTLSPPLIPQIPLQTLLALPDSSDPPEDNVCPPNLSYGSQLPPKSWVAILNSINLLLTSLNVFTQPKKGSLWPMGTQWDRCLQSMGVTSRVDTQSKPRERAGRAHRFGGEKEQLYYPCQELLNCLGLNYNCHHLLCRLGCCSSSSSWLLFWS